MDKAAQSIKALSILYSVGRSWFFFIWRRAQAEWPNEPKQNANPINANSEAAGPFIPLENRATRIIKNNIIDIINRNLYSPRFLSSYIAIFEIRYKECFLTQVLGRKLCGKLARNFLWASKVIFIEFRSFLKFIKIFIRCFVALARPELIFFCNSRLTNPSTRPQFISRQILRQS